MGAHLEYLKTQLGVAQGFARHAPLEALQRARYVAAEAQRALASLAEHERNEMHGVLCAATRKIKVYQALFDKQQDEIRAREQALLAREGAPQDHELLLRKLELLSIETSGETVPPSLPK